MNPLIKTVHCADPSVHVWPDSDRIWIYSSHDEPGTNTCDSMKSYHVFSSDDMLNFVDHGRVLDISNVPWAGKQMWAIDAAYRNGFYYLVFCAFEAKTGVFRTGLAKSDRPEGPFVDDGYIDGVRWGQDPALFVDDDNTPYLFVGAGHCIEAYQLTDDLKSVVDGTYVDLTPQLPWAFEGPWVHKYNGKYYLTYPGLYENKWPEHMYYAVSDKPLGPYEFKGQYIENFEGNSTTNHGSVVEYKNKWYAFHHSKWVSNQDACRNIMCDYLEYNEDGTIKPIIPSKNGVCSLNNKSYDTKVSIVIDASTAELSGGRIAGAYPDNKIDGYTGDGYLTGFDHIYNGVTALMQSCTERKVKLYIRYILPENNEKLKLMVNNILIGSAEDDMDYDKRISISKCDDWTEQYIATVTLKPGDNLIDIYVGEHSGSNIIIDYIKAEEV